ncbi:MAG: hypothetical protein DRP74_07070 [Candidatus Omnitrophota bacterium]|nr:MAG: hypothetical protein DRP74_07070 [Candidatus Omnitrophota bacterium]
MQFAEIRKEINSIAFDSLRTDAKDYFEAVLVNDQIMHLTPRLEKFFKSPVWPSQNRLPSAIKNIIADFGGIMPGQTLYFLSQDNSHLFAMLWPWSDGRRTTLKIARK